MENRELIFTEKADEQFIDLKTDPSQALTAKKYLNHMLSKKLQELIVFFGITDPNEINLPLLP